MKPQPNDRAVAIMKLPTRSYQTVDRETYFSITNDLEDLRKISPRVKVWREFNWIHIYGPTRYDDTIEDRLQEIMERYGDVKLRIEWVADDSDSCSLPSGKNLSDFQPPVVNYHSENSSASEEYETWEEFAEEYGYCVECENHSVCRDAKQRFLIEQTRSNR